MAYVYDPERRLPPLCNVDVAGDLFAVEDGKVRAAPSRRRSRLGRLGMGAC